MGMHNVGMKGADDEEKSYEGLQILERGKGPDKGRKGEETDTALPCSCEIFGYGSRFGSGNVSNSRISIQEGNFIAGRVKTGHGKEGVFRRAALIEAGNDMDDACAISAPSTVHTMPEIQ